MESARRSSKIESKWPSFCNMEVVESGSWGDGRNRTKETAAVRE